MKSWLIAVVSVVVFAGVCKADTLDFGSNAVEPVGATISYAGGSAALIGSGIGVQNISDVTTSTTETCTGCTLAFTTGASTGTWTWGAGAAGSISISGTAGAASGTLLTGTIKSASIVGCNGGTCIDVNTFINTVNSTLQSFFGVNNPNWAGSDSINILLSASAGSAFSLDKTHITSGDLTTSPVPEPASLTLLGSGLLGLAGLARRKFFTT